MAIRVHIDGRRAVDGDPRAVMGDAVGTAVSFGGVQRPHSSSHADVAVHICSIHRTRAISIVKVVRKRIGQCISSKNTGFSEIC